MNKSFIIIVLILCQTFLGFGQTEKQALKVLKKTKSKNQALTLWKKDPKTTAYRTFTRANPWPDYQDLFNQKVGSIHYRLQKGGREYDRIVKVIGRDSVTVNSYGKICFINENHDLNEMDSLRNRVISEYKQGVPFDSLSQIYTPGRICQLPWSTTCEIEAIATGLASHSIGDVFKVDAVESNQYCVINKNLEPITTEEIQILIAYYSP